MILSVGRTAAHPVRRGAVASLLLATFVFASALRAQGTDSTARGRDSTARGADSTVQGAAPALPAALGTVSGTVFDSLHGTPLRGATVMLAGTMHSGTSDANGHYVIDSVQAGQYQIGFFHALLDSLGLGLAPQAITVPAGAVVHVDLTIPSSATIMSQLCPDSALGDKLGMVAGVVHNADNGAPLAGAIVVLSWMGYRITGGKLFKMLQAANTKTDATGAYHVCGVPAGVTITARAHSGTRGSGQAELQVEKQQLALQDISLSMASADSGKGTVVGGVARSGSAVLTGTVTSSSGKPLQGAQATVLGTTIGGTTDEQGVFHLDSLPSGTQTVEVRMIGYLPKRATVALRSTNSTKVGVVLAERVPVLEPVKVVGKKRNADWLHGFDKRMKQGFGHFITRKQIEERSPIEITDVFRGIPGVNVQWTGSDYTLAMNRSVSLSGSCPINYVLDGMSISVDNINNVIQPEDVQAIEVYQAGDEPVQFSGPTAGCGTVVIWSRRPGISK
ncbi:MAG TPA: carboxypeptidase regulatory-like domain-containing protein [Gemmatimonadaceae bacterium]|nr:carboxypeptidase regulatory-like domain-containing protein [Gemmatimonadaceae bacterium]